MDALHAVLAKLETVRKTAGGYTARCPAHEDRKPSLTINAGSTHPVVLHCQAGCDRDAVLAALGLDWRDLCAATDDQPAAGEWTPAGEAIAVYDYVDEGGTLLFQVLRTASKEFRQRIPDSTATSGWRWKVGDTRRVPYRLPDLIAAVTAGKTVWVCEGEKDVHALERAGVVATCNPGGAGKWRTEYAEHLREADVTIVADRDTAGQSHARQVAATLNGVAASVRIVEAAVGKDAADHLGAGRSLADFETTWTSDQPTQTDLAPDLWEFISTEDEPYNWVVPGLIERADRVMITGFEGLGKSMMIRQLAVQIAAGIHPFKHTPMPPCKVLLIDLENTERQSRRKFRPLAAASITAHHRVPDGALRLIHRPAGIDLTRSEDAAWLLERVTAHQPDVLFIGPLYRLHVANLNEELPARKVVDVLDKVRTQVDCALVVEAHAGHAGNAAFGGNRSVRPVGSSLFLRWPEFGFGIAPNPDYPYEPGGRCKDVLVQPWRSGRDDRAWPTHLTWGSHGWPWLDAGKGAGQEVEDDENESPQPAQATHPTCRTCGRDIYGTGRDTCGACIQAQRKGAA